MFTAITPVFNKLYEIFEAEYASGDNPTFKTFQKGFQFEGRKSIEDKDFPWAFLNWQTVTEPAFFRAPRTYQYNSIYSLTILTRADRAKQSDLLFNVAHEQGFSGNANDHNINPGIGDLIQTICSFLFRQHRQTLFTSRPANSKWDMISWNYARISDPELSLLDNDFSSLLADPLTSSKRIEITTSISEYV